MRLASYSVAGEADFGVVVEDGVVAMKQRLGGKFAGLKEVLAAGALDQVRRLAQNAPPDHRLADLRFLPVIPQPEKVICVGINYPIRGIDTAAEARKRPGVFSRFTDTLIGHEAEMIRPTVSECYDFEGELALIIGRAARHVTPEQALDYVAGYSCFVDGSVRDYQKDGLTSGKNFPGSGPLGPWMVTADEIPDPTRLVLMTRVNGQEMQRSGVDRLIHSIPEVIAYISDFTPLSPGDVISTGSPDGAGHRLAPPVWMKAGDVVEVEITGIGTLRSRVVDERPAAASR